MKFEYAIVSAREHGKGVSGEQQAQLLRDCGEAGWELVSIIPQKDGDIWFYFKGTKLPAATVRFIGESEHVDAKKARSKH